MSYKDEYHPKVKSDLKKLDRAVAREIHDEHIDRILLEPFAYEKLHGDLEGAIKRHCLTDNVPVPFFFSRKIGTC